MLSIRQCSFRLSVPEDTVHLVVACPRSRFKEANRFLTASYSASGEPRAVLLAFISKQDAHQASNRIEVPGTKHLLSVDLREAAWMSFNRMCCDLVVVHALPTKSDGGTWQVFYARADGVLSHDALPLNLCE